MRTVTVYLAIAAYMSASVADAECILLATRLDECKKSYLGKTWVFDTKSFVPCRDVRVNGYKETEATYILDLPALVHFWGEEQLEDAPEEVLGPRRY